MLKIVTVSMDKNVVEKFDELRELDGLSRSARIEMLLRQDLRNRKISLH